MTEPARIALARLPTPLVRLERLGPVLGVKDAQVWIKRDDLTGLELSGNKVRKLEFIVADALATGCDTLVTEGTSQSNHCRATAAVCARLGLRCELLLRPRSDAPPQGNHLLDRLFGANLRWFSREELSADRAGILARLVDELTAAGHKPRVMPTGASEPLGCWGYIRAAAELAEQLRDAQIGACDVVVATSSCGTAAGLLLGKLLHWPAEWRLNIVPVSDDVAYHQREIERLCRATSAQFALPGPFSWDGCELIDGYVGAGYAIPFDRALEALRTLARSEAILLDPVYTAKTFCAVVDGIRTGRFGSRRPVVFVHTGGVFSNFTWPEIVDAE